MSEEVEEIKEEENQMLTDLDPLEKQCCKENFEFYDKEK